MKRKYSKPLKELQEIERGVSKAANRLAHSVEQGIRAWREATEKSARRKRDGAIRDALKNYMKAAGRQVRIASFMPLDVIKNVPRLNPRRFLARVLLPIYKR